MIEFNKPPFIGTELEYIRQAAEENNKLCGDGPLRRNVLPGCRTIST